MNLLILGAGGHGRVVRETAEAMRMYDDIAFLDDHNPDAVGKLDDYKAFRDRFDAAFVAIGDNELRSQWLEKLKLAGYQIPTLIHPRAYVSPLSTIGSGSIVEPLACINTGVVVDEGCIISISAVIDHDSRIGSFSHIDCGVIIASRTRVDSYRKLESINFYQTDNSDRELDNGETSKVSVLSEKQRCENPH